MELIDFAESSVSHMPPKEWKQIAKVVVVFDKDNHTNQEVEQAIAKARSLKIDVAFSNICFETWLLMHFESVVTAIPSNILHTKLEKLFNVESYSRSKGNKKMLGKLEDLIQHAI